MRLVIDDYGAYLKKTGGRLVVVSGERREEYSSDKVEQVMILRGAAVSTDAVKLAMEKNIDIVCLDRSGRPYARIYPCRLGGTTLTRRNQLGAYSSRKGVILAGSFVKAKIENMGYFLKTLGKSRNNESLKAAGKNVLGFSKRIRGLRGGIDDIRNSLLGMEGESSKVYFSALAEALPAGVYSGSRTRRPPKDIFNALLSYGYGILYSEVENSCITSGLDPYLGFLHTDRYGKPSMVLDLIEEFRQPIVDRAMVTLVVRNRVGEKEVKRETGVFLNKDGRRKAIEAMMKRLEARVKHKGRKTSLQDVILRQARDIVRFINGELRAYKPFIYRW